MKRVSFSAVLSNKRAQYCPTGSKYQWSVKIAGFGTIPGLCSKAQGKASTELNPGELSKSPEVIMASL